MDYSFSYDPDADVLVLVAPAAARPAWVRLEITDPRAAFAALPRGVRLPLPDRGAEPAPADAEDAPRPVSRRGSRRPGSPCRG
jgi:hypothetical protein